MWRVMVDTSPNADGKYVATFQECDEAGHATQAKAKRAWLKIERRLRESIAKRAEAIENVEGSVLEHQLFTRQPSQVDAWILSQVDAWIEAVEGLVPKDTQ